MKIRPQFLVVIGLIIAVLVTVVVVHAHHKENKFNSDANCYIQQVETRGATTCP